VDYRVSCPGVSVFDNGAVVERDLFLWNGRRGVGEGRG
jgi:hypothetical protein